VYSDHPWNKKDSEDHLLLRGGRNVIKVLIGTSKWQVIASSGLTIILSLTYAQYYFLLTIQTYSVFHRFRQAKFDNGGSILSSNQFSLLPQLPQEMKLTFKVVKIVSK
jgi:hypothetical protein